MTTTARWRPRAAALLAGGAFALHQLRYLFGYGEHSHGELASQGHAYMAVLAPLLAVTLMLAAADFGARLLGARAAQREGSAPRLRGLWALATAALLAAYGLQETLEGVLAPGHPGGLAALLGHGGWAALPLAAAIGLVVAVLVRGAHRAIELAAEPSIRVAAPRAVISLTSFARGHAPRGRRLARHLGGRSPPHAAIP